MRIAGNKTLKDSLKHPKSALAPSPAPSLDLPVFSTATSSAPYFATTQIPWPLPLTLAFHSNCSPYAPLDPHPEHLLDVPGVMPVRQMCAKSCFGGGLFYLALAPPLTRRLVLHRRIHHQIIYKADLVPELCWNYACRSSPGDREK